MSSAYVGMSRSKRIEKVHSGELLRFDEYVLVPPFLRLLLLMMIVAVVQMHWRYAIRVVYMSLLSTLHAALGARQCVGDDMAPGGVPDAMARVARIHGVEIIIRVHGGACRSRCCRLGFIC